MRRPVRQSRAHAPSPRRRTIERRNTRLPVSVRRCLRYCLCADPRTSVGNGSGGERLLAQRPSAAAGALLMERGCVGPAPRLRVAPPSRRGRALFRGGPGRVALVDYLHVGRQSTTLLANLAPLFDHPRQLVLLAEEGDAPLPRLRMVTAIAGMFVLVGPNFAAGWDEIGGGRSGRPHRRVLRGIHVWRSRQRAMPGCRPCDSWRWSTSITAVAFHWPRPRVLSPQPSLPSESHAVGRSCAALALVSQVLGQGLIGLWVRAPLRIALKREPALAAGPGDALCLGDSQRNDRRLRKSSAVASCSGESGSPSGGS